MRKYQITVNGQSYEVELEEVGGFTASAPVSAPVAAAAAPVAAPVAIPAGGETIKCPMPGTILSINVQAGSSVKKGDVLLILEAMKMENEIMAPREGTVTQVMVNKGSTVATGEVLVYLA